MFLLVIFGVKSKMLIFKLWLLCLILIMGLVRIDKFCFKVVIVNVNEELIKSLVDNCDERNFGKFE